MLTFAFRSSLPNEYFSNSQSKQQARNFVKCGPYIQALPSRRSAGQPGIFKARTSRQYPSAPPIHRSGKHSRELRPAGGQSCFSQTILNEYFTDSKQKLDWFDAGVVYTWTKMLIEDSSSKGGLMKSPIRSWVTSHRQEMRNWVSRGGPLRLVIHIVRLVS